MLVSIVDYGLSNLLSVQRAVQRLGYTPRLCSMAEELASAPCIILPGVGAFRDGMAGLARLGMPAALRAAAARGTPVLGICLGMQMLFEQSEEFGTHAGLGLIPGCVRRIPEQDAGGVLQRVPHIGWNALEPPAGQVGFSPALLQSTASGEEVYFVHSYEAHPQHECHRLADTVYGGRRVCAAAGHGSVVGVQFHPEKSGEVGLAILGAFLQSCQSP